MKKYTLRNKSQWDEISQRPLKDNNSITELVNGILAEVKNNGDSALKKFALQFDGLNLASIKATKEEITNASNQLSLDLKQSIKLASDNISKFHSNQLQKEEPITTSSGVTCWRENRAIEKVGLYIPGGSAPLFSTVLMLGIPAKLAGCKEVIICTPPQKDGSIHPAILYTANLLGITDIFKVGGAQAVAAMGYGTESIPKVYKIFGPGNQYVTKAKELIQQEGIAIDMPAGPSEVLVIADETCIPEFVAADLLSQAEHGADSQVVLLATSIEVLNEIENEVLSQLEDLPRRSIAKAALNNSRFVYCNSIEECFDLSNYYAPEHLIVASDNAMRYCNKIINAGSVFIGNYSCESAGDYASGTNHTLPTNGYARNYSGVSVESFIRKVTFQKLTKEGIRAIGPSIENMAETENLIAHKNAVTIRLKKIENEIN